MVLKSVYQARNWWRIFTALGERAWLTSAARQQQGCNCISLPYPS